MTTTLDYALTNFFLDAFLMFFFLSLAFYLLIFKNFKHVVFFLYDVIMKKLTIND